MIKRPEDLTPIPNDPAHGCFGCGAVNAHGLQMKFFTDRKQVYSFLQVPETMIGWKRIVHGGVVTTILDEIMAWTAIYLFGQLGVTKSINVEFKKPVICGTGITALGGLQEKISDTAVCMFGRIYDEDESLCAQATGQFKMIRPETAIRLGILGKDDIGTYGPMLDVDDDA